MPPGNRMRMASAPERRSTACRVAAGSIALPVPERITALSDPAVRQRLAAGAASEEAGVLRGVANWPVLQLVETFSPANAQYRGRSVAEVAAERGQEPFDALLDIVIVDELRTGLRPPSVPETPDDRAYRLEVWRDPRTIIGGSDAGAHLDMMCGAVYSTSLLAGVRTFGDLSIEEAVHLLTDVPARFYGLKERGRVHEGWWADLVLFDPETVGYGPETSRDDLPGGASRLYTESTGIQEVLAERDGSRAGRPLHRGNSRTRAAIGPRHRDGGRPWRALARRRGGNGPIDGPAAMSWTESRDPRNHEGGTRCVEEHRGHLLR